MEEPVKPETPAIEGTRKIRVPMIPKPPKTVEETGLTLGRAGMVRLSEVFMWPRASARSVGID